MEDYHKEYLLKNPDGEEHILGSQDPNSNMHRATPNPHAYNTKQFWDSSRVSKNST